MTTSDVISPETAVTLDGLFSERVRRSGQAVAYRDFDDTRTSGRITPGRRWSAWSRVGRQRSSGRSTAGGSRGDHAAQFANWVMFDQAALGLGLVVVPLYTQDRPDNVAYIIQNCAAKVLLFDQPEQWAAFSRCDGSAGQRDTRAVHEPLRGAAADARLQSVTTWLPPDDGKPVRHLVKDAGSLASIIYTSGTTGKPKGVMLRTATCCRTRHATLQCSA